MILITPLRKQLAMKRLYGTTTNAKLALGIDSEDDPCTATWGDVARWHHAKQNPLQENAGIQA